jgi:death-on-curing protein
MKLTIEIVLYIHQRQIERYGGLSGIRAINLLESAVARPFHTFDSIDLYQSSLEKAAALFEAMIKNHPFVDGNKRVAYACLELFLELEGYQIKQTEDEKYSFVIQAASSQIEYDGILAWLKRYAFCSE